ncbi:unnamed protein product [Zymoseptoria tritici ST99CH_3D1]|nr:unnamed protein product [Zymoseptoria tritici ST99CH_3D1]
MAPKQNPKKAKATAPTKKQTTLTSYQRNNVDALGLISISVLGGQCSLVAEEDLEVVEEAAAKITACQTTEEKQAKAMWRIEAAITEKRKQLAAIPREAQKEMDDLLGPMTKLLTARLSKTNDGLVKKLSSVEESNTELVTTNNTLTTELNNANESIKKLTGERDELALKLGHAHKSDKLSPTTDDSTTCSVGLSSELVPTNVDLTKSKMIVTTSRNEELETANAWNLQLFRDNHNLANSNKQLTRELRCFKYQSRYIAGRGAPAVQAALQPVLQHLLHDSQMRMTLQIVQTHLRHDMLEEVQTAFEEYMSKTLIETKAFKERKENEVRAAEELVKTNEKELPEERTKLADRFVEFGKVVIAKGGFAKEDVAVLAGLLTKL